LKCREIDHGKPFPRALQFQLPREQGPHWKEVKVQSVAITGRYSYASNSDQKSGGFFLLHQRAKHTLPCFQFLPSSGGRMFCEHDSENYCIMFDLSKLITQLNVNSDFKQEML
jgi:hypothetical protein